MIDALTAWRCGEVRRWHAHPDHRLRESGDNTGGHTFRVMGLAMDLWWDLEPAVLYAIRRHDMGEAGACGGAGDVPNPAKDADPEMAAAFDRKELKALRSMGFDRIILTPDQEMQVRLCDKLDAYLWMLERAPDLAPLPGWRRDLDGIDFMAKHLGVQGQVWAILLNASRDVARFERETMGGDQVVERDGRTRHAGGPLAGKSGSDGSGVPPCD